MQVRKVTGRMCDVVEKRRERRPSDSRPILTLYSLSPRLDSANGDKRAT